MHCTLTQGHFGINPHKEEKQMFTTKEISLAKEYIAEYEKEISELEKKRTEIKTMLEGSDRERFSLQEELLTVNDDIIQLNVELEYFLRMTEQSA